MNSDYRLTVLHDPVSDDAVLSGGALFADLPLSNLQVPKEYWRVARFVDADPDNTWFNIDLGASRLVQGCVCGPGNFTKAATGQLIKFADGSYSTPVLTLDLPRLGARQPWGTLPFGAPYWWTGLDAWRNPERRASLISVFDQSIAGRYWQMRINDPGNPQPVEAGRLFMAGAWVPQFNYSPDNNSFTIEDNAKHVEMLSGARRSRRRTNPRSFGFAVERSDDDQVFGPYFRLIDLAGYDRELFLIQQPSDVVHLQDRSFFATIRAMSAIRQEAMPRASYGFEALEIIS